MTCWSTATLFLPIFYSKSVVSTELDIRDTSPPQKVIRLNFINTLPDMTPDKNDYSIKFDLNIVIINFQLKLQIHLHSVIAHRRSNSTMLEIFLLVFNDKGCRFLWLSVWFSWQKCWWNKISGNNQIFDYCDLSAKIKVLGKATRYSRYKGVNHKGFVYCWVF